MTGWQLAGIIAGWAMTLIAGAYKLGSIHNDVKTIRDNHIPHLQQDLEKLETRFNSLIERLAGK